MNLRLASGGPAALWLVCACGCSMPLTLVAPRGDGGYSDRAAPDVTRVTDGSGAGEICGNGVDDNGNGRIDEGCPCLPGTTQRCYSGPFASRGVGTCSDGTQLCEGVSADELGQWGECRGDVRPTAETCDGRDHDCDGVAGDGCACAAGTTRACATEYARLAGPCRAGQQTCQPDGRWPGACEGAVGPSPDACGDGVDNDCDGVVDNGCSGPGPDAGADASPDAGPDAGPCDPPRLIAPLSTARASSRRPTLRIAPAAGATGATIEICRDRACTSVLQTLASSGASAAPTADLPPGVVFWRARSRRAAGTCTTPSATWELFVGRRSAPTDLSWGTTMDLNGDGLADLAASAYGGGGDARVFYGSAAGLPATPSVLLHDPSASGFGFGAQIVDAGDLNGDGFADLALGQYSGTDHTGEVLVYFGGAAGVPAAPSLTLRGFDGPDGWFGSSIAAAGDVNGDGYADLVALALRVGAGVPNLYVFHGGPAGVAAPPNTVAALPGTPDSFWYETRAAGAGDVNGDGFADVAVGATCAPSSGRDASGAPICGAGRLYVFLGGASGLATAPVAMIDGTRGPSHYFGSGVSSAGDVDGDGYPDLAVGEFERNLGPGHVYIFRGGSAGLRAAPAVTLDGPDGVGGFFGVATAGAGDVNGDGYADLVVGASAAAMMGGRAHLYLGGAAGLGTSPSVSWTGMGGAGLSVAGLGDTDGDGFAEVAVGASTANSWAGQVLLFRGSPAGAAASPSRSWDGHDREELGLPIAGAGAGGG